MLIFIVVKVALSKLQDINAACTKAMGIAMWVFVKFRSVSHGLPISHIWRVAGRAKLILHKQKGKGRKDGLVK